jgi:hypothetical protein
MRPLDRWEAQWAPYDEACYQTVLSHVRPDDVILDIGAGDLRLARQIARVARHVYAIEMQPHLIKPGSSLPGNLGVICADARSIPWPSDITLAVLLMRHCSHLGLYVARLRAVGCRRLITNARWGLDVELVDLGPRASWRTVKIGWYACICGQTGFVPGPPSRLTETQMEYINEVETCPVCSPAAARQPEARD